MIPGREDGAEVAARAIDAEDHVEHAEVVTGEHLLQQVACHPHVRLVLAASVVHPTTEATNHQHPKRGCR